MLTHCFPFLLAFAGMLIDLYEQVYPARKEIPSPEDTPPQWLVWLANGEEVVARSALDSKRQLLVCVRGQGEWQAQLWRHERAPVIIGDTLLIANLRAGDRGNQDSLLTVVASKESWRLCWEWALT
jgi:hypothetical protein